VLGALAFFTGTLEALGVGMAVRLSGNILEERLVLRLSVVEPTLDATLIRRDTLRCLGSGSLLAKGKSAIVWRRLALDAARTDSSSEPLPAYDVAGFLPRS
jgi:hypothetical protein